MADMLPALWIGHRRLVLRMTASVHFLPAAARARTLLYRRMTNGCVPGAPRRCACPRTFCF